MKVTWLGQAGLLIESEAATVMIDPYFSDSVKERSDPAKARRMPIDERFFEVEPDFLLFTHNHLDHYDPLTAPIYLEHQKPMTVLAPSSVLAEARKCGQKQHNYVQMNRHTRWTEKGFRFTSVKAEHSDLFAVGFIIEELSAGKKLYVTGDTLYNEEIFGDLPSGIDVIFLPINGAGNNMNELDALDFFKRSGAKKAVPLHFGMFDDLRPTLFETIPELYGEIII